jgi:hypothetical protein
VYFPQSGAIAVVYVLFAFALVCLAVSNLLFCEYLYLNFTNQVALIFDYGAALLDLSPSLQ